MDARGVAGRRPDEQEVRLAGPHPAPQLLEASGQAATALDDAAGDALRIGGVANGRGPHPVGHRADVVAVLHLPEPLEHRRRCDGVAEAKAREPVALRQGPQDDDVGALPDEVEGVGLGEGDVGLVDHQEAVERVGETGEGGRLRGGPRRAVGVGHERQRPARLGEGRDGQDEVVVEGHLHHRGLLDAREGPVQHVRRGGVDHGPARPGDRADEHREHVVAAVAGENPRRVDVEGFGRRLAELPAGRVRIAAQRVAVDGGERGHRVGARGVRVLVRVQLDDPGARLGLPARDVGLEGVDGGAEEGHGGQTTRLGQRPLQHCRLRPDAARFRGFLRLAGGKAASVTVL